MRILDQIWRPRTEFGRKLKHKILFGGNPPAQRGFRRRR